MAGDDKLGQDMVIHNTQGQITYARAGEDTMLDVYRYGASGGEMSSQFNRAVIISPLTSDVTVSKFSYESASSLQGEEERNVTECVAVRGPGRDEYDPNGIVGQISATAYDITGGAVGSPAYEPVDTPGGPAIYCRPMDI